MAAYTSTALGPPRSGRFAVNDTVTDGQGIIWRCVRATSPRQWLPADDSGAVQAVTGLSVTELGTGAVGKTKFTFVNMPVAVTDTNAYGSQKIYTFSIGRILVLGATGKVNFKVQGASTTINNAATLNWGIGTAAASSLTLATTMINMLPGTGETPTAVATGTNPAASADSPAVLAATPAHYDGTTSAIAAYFNVAIPTNTEIDADGVLLVNGSATVVWTNFGDV